MSAAIQLTPAEIARLRQRIADTVERLIALMDILDGDSDLEDTGDLEETGDDEPCLGAPEAAEYVTTMFTDAQGVRWAQRSYWTQVCWAGGGDDDREDDPGENGIADFDGLNEQLGMDGPGDVLDGPDPWRQ